MAQKRIEWRLKKKQKAWPDSKSQSGGPCRLALCPCHLLTLSQCPWPLSAPCLPASGPCAPAGCSRAGPPSQRLNFSSTRPTHFPAPELLRDSECVYQPGCQTARCLPVHQSAVERAVGEVHSHPWVGTGWAGADGRADVPKQSVTEAGMHLSSPPS